MALSLLVKILAPKNFKDTINYICLYSWYQVWSSTIYTVIYLFIYKYKGKLVILQSIGII